MGIYGIDTVTHSDKKKMKDLLNNQATAVSVDRIVDEEDNPFDDKREAVSVLHALLSEGEVSHNLSREYYLTS